jgi:PAS domain-containing protein
MVKLMQCAAYGHSLDQLGPPARDADGPPNHRTRFHRGCGASLQLLDHSRAVVMEMGKRPHGPVVSRMTGSLEISSGALASPPPRQVNMKGSIADPRLGAVFESSGEALLVLDAEGVIHKANSRACELIQTTVERVPGENLSEFLSPQSARDFAVSCKLASAMRPAGSADQERIDAYLSTGFPVRITFRAMMPDWGACSSA